ncbi:Silent information regulator protein Sir2 [Kribbella flavida DSM 17836]|uniref:protein acetyllysine N-acetyltransferase n=1 Tax=Kribbella flavida (strain DSM 17836 / JCM 10339 / NBRC 14399) TaxID=479435 RepID=D2PZ47_KRIFD|nr:Sir2 family NAD-dependent protein deacetylase [Kribbella flavida]ADB31841.1 Silent information regulator protein Sir2 [Kribbella flavida DSM 17836]
MTERWTVLTGAGISTASGIPDFRGPQGLWTKDPAAQAMFDIDEYVASAAVRAAAWRHRMGAAAWTAEPNAGHHALVELEKQGRLTGLITQNIDGLHQKAGSTGVLELHGTMWFVDCLSCGRRIPMEEVVPRLEAGEQDPACLVCGGILKSATVSFGQSLDQEVLDAAVAATQACDIFLAVGTSLQVYPAAGLCDVALAAGKRLVIVNAEPTPYDEQADQVLRTPIETTLPGLVVT